MKGLVDPAAARDAQRLAECELEIAQLKRIRDALMVRVERSMDVQGSAFSLFQTAIMLEAQVRNRTESLERALADLERSSQETALARRREEASRLRLFAAIERISEGFALFDAADRLLLFNQQYLKFWPGLADRICTGMRFAEIVALAVEHKSVADAFRDPDDWERRRLAQHADPQGPSIHALSDGRWMQVDEQRTPDGGSVCVYTDITDLKRREALHREAALAEQNALLQSTLDNIFQGVAVYDGGRVLVAWNNEFIRLLGLPPEVARPGASFDDFLAFNARLGGSGIQLPALVSPARFAVPFGADQTWHDGKVLRIQGNPMPDGGFVLTFADITERKRTEQALRDGQHRIRLITDAMPALIAYVDIEQRYQFVNEPYRKWLGRPEAAIIGQKMRDVLDAAQYDRRKPFIEQCLRGTAAAFDLELTPVGSREPRFGYATYVPHIGDHGEILGCFTLIQDVTERRQAATALKEANETLERRVQERTSDLTRLNTLLQQAKSEAETANLGKTKFLAAASHDLLQPLNAARLFVSALIELDQPRQNRVLIGNVDESLSSVEDLLGALLDISKLDAGGVEPEIIDFPITSLLGPLGTEYGAVARDRGLDFRLVPSGAVVRSDIRLLRRIVQNFLTNAIRYTSQGRILLGCRRRDGQLRIEVWDTGPGIPADKFEAVFEEFQRLQTRARKRDRGIGLGLAIVRRIATTLGIPVDLRSTIGRGSMFAITVPLGLARIAAPARAAAEPGIDLLAGSVVLAIDNEHSILAGMDALLGSWGCITHVALSGDEALRMLPHLPKPPDVVIADYHLDDGRIGSDEIRRLAQAIGRPVPGIIISADRNIAAEIKREGYWLLNKPVKPAQLRSLMNRIVGAK